MNTENALLGLILAGIGLCLGYFWVEIARRNQDRTRLQSKLGAPSAASGKKMDIERTEPALPRSAQKIDRQKAA